MRRSSFMTFGFSLLIGFCCFFSNNAFANADDGLAAVDGVDNGASVSAADKGSTNSNGNGNDAPQSGTVGDPIPSYVRIVPAVFMVIFFIAFIGFIFLYERKKAASKTKRDIQPLEDESIGQAWLTQIKTVQQASKAEEEKKKPKLTTGQKQLERKFQLYDEMLDKYKKSIKDRPATSSFKSKRAGVNPLTPGLAQAKTIKELAFKHRAMSISSSENEAAAAKPNYWYQSIESSGSEKGKQDAAEANGCTVETIIVPSPQAAKKIDNDNKAFDQSDERAPLMPSPSVDEPEIEMQVIKEEQHAMPFIEDENSPVDKEAEIESKDKSVIIQIKDDNENNIPIEEQGDVRIRPKTKRPNRPLSWVLGRSSSMKRKKLRPQSVSIPEQEQLDSLNNPPTKSHDAAEPGPSKHLWSTRKPSRPKSLDVGRHYNVGQGQSALSRARSLLLRSMADEDEMDIDALKKESLFRKSESEMADIISEVEQEMVYNITSSQSHLYDAEVEALEKLLDDVSRFCDDYYSDRESWKTQTSFSEAENQLSERGTPSVGSSALMPTMDYDDFTPSPSPLPRNSKYDFDEFQNSLV